MIMKSNHTECPDEFAELFSFDSLEKRLEYGAQMYSFRVLSEVEKLCNKKKIKKKDLAAMVGTSASYITQLFRGDKHINSNMVARFQEIFDICFEIKVRANDQTHSEFLFSQVCELNMRRFKYKQQVWNRLDTDVPSRNAQVLDLYCSGKTKKETA